MGNLLPDRHPNKDFFVLDVKEASPKDDMASMEHPVYSLATKPDMRELEYEHRGNMVRIVPSGLGLATIFDKDIILYAISKAAHMARDAEITPWVEMTAHEVMVATNWRTSKHQYKRFEDALVRLRGTTIVTNVRTGDHLQTRGFGLVDEFEIDRKDEMGELSPFGRMSKVRLKLSDWTFRAVQAGQVLTLNPIYFRLRRPIERRIYELARKHVGDQKKWEIGLATLQKKVGSNSSLKKFRFVVREVIADGNIPDYSMELVQDKVVFTHSNASVEAIPNVTVRESTLEKAREIAQEKGYDFHGLMSEWERMASIKGAPKNPDAALLGFMRQKPNIRTGRLL